MKNLIPVEGMEGLYRDPHSGAIINNNNNDYQTYIIQREKLNSDRENFEKLKSEVNSMKSDMDQIKFMLNNITDLLNK